MTRSPEKLQQILSELKADYLRSLPQKFLHLKSLTEKEEWAALEREYHKLKGNGKTYGFPEISVLCEKLEVIATHPGLRTRPLFEQALQMLEELRQAYEQGQEWKIENHPFARTLLQLPKGENP